MIEEFRKSIQSILYERISSPFSGAFFISWIVWNWKIIYYLCFSSDDVLYRINYVQENYLNINQSLLFPLLSTIFLIVLFPFVTTAAYWIWLKFKTWQLDIRNDVENKQLLTLEKSIELRMTMRTQVEKYEDLLKKRENEITMHIEEINVLRKQINDLGKDNNSDLSSDENKLLLEEFDAFKKSNWANLFNEVMRNIQTNKYLSGFIDYKTVAYYESNDIIKKQKVNPQLYEFTSKGKKFVNLYLQDKSI